MKKRLRWFFDHPRWSFVGFVLSVFVYHFPNNAVSDSIYVNLIIKSARWVILGGIFFAFIYAMLKPKYSVAEKVLREIASHHKEKECSLWYMGRDCASVLQINDTWNQWIAGLIKVTGRTDLEPHNFADHFYLYDLSRNQIIEFPKDKFMREAIIGNRFGNGKLIRVMEKE